LYQKVFLGDLRARNLSAKTVEASGDASSQRVAFLPHGVASAVDAVHGE